MISKQARILAELMLPYKVGVISYGATLTLSTNEFPNFLQTVPSDKDELVAIISLLEKFNWTLITPLFSSDLYGYSGKKIFSDLALKKNISFPCLTSIPVGLNYPVDEAEYFLIDDIITCIKAVPNLRVVILYMNTLQAIAVLSVFYRSKAFDLQFIFSDAASEAFIDASRIDINSFPASYLVGILVY